MLKLIFKFFLELIFARQEEYDFKSKHFKPSKVIFSGIVIVSFILNFFLVSGMFRLGVQYIDLHDECKKTPFVIPKKGDKNQSPESLDSQKSRINNDEE